MSTEPHKQEHPNTYFVQDRSNKDELARLRIQDQMLSANMGGVLSEQIGAHLFQRVLDVGCGSGSWVIETAQSYPSIVAFGIDVNQRMIEYARTQASVQGVADRVEFHTMDALLMLEFPANFFDLVNMRLSASFQRTWDWPKMISEMRRVLRPGGVVRITESNIVHQSNSPALTQLCEMFQCALAEAGHLFEPATTGITAHLNPLLIQHGVEHVQSIPHVLEYRAGTPAGQAYYENTRYMFRNIRPFLQKWGCASPAYDAIYQQALDEMQLSNFHSVWTLVTAWGTTPIEPEQSTIPMTERY